MKIDQKKARWLLIAALACLFAPRPAASQGRVTLFDEGWHFHLGDTTEAERPGFRDSGWERVTLPHDWSIRGPYGRQWASATAYLPGGIGWYRKTFAVPAGDREKKVYIRFDGIYKDSKVWINGHFLGERPNGFVSFRYDMTPYLRFGGSNVIAVRVNHSEFADSRWYTGSGIYRNAYLEILPRLHISHWGVVVSPEAVSARQAMLHIQVALHNETTTARKIALENVIRDTAGAIVARSSVTRTIRAGGRDTVSGRLRVAHPARWSVSRPALYSLETVVTSGGRPVDRKTTTVGIRSIRFDADSGFFLNGENIKLKGVCLHDDAGCLGVAVPAEVWKRRLAILKAAGCNAIRLSHNPHDPELYDLCDKMGFLLIDEAFDEWELGKHKWIEGWNAGKPGTDGYHEYFDRWADTDLRDMILRDRNHPSVILWSIGNEIDYPNDPYSDTELNGGRHPQMYGKGYLSDHPSAENLGRIARRLVRTVKAYDTTHPVTAALAAAVVSTKVGYAEALDVTGYNYQEYLYPGDHRKYPERKIYGSENGMSYEAWKAVRDQPFVAGQFLWTGIDYLGEAGKWPSRGSHAGLLDLAGFPKPEYYFRQSIWTNNPMIYIGTAKPRRLAGQASVWAQKRADPLWNYQQGDTIQVNCFTNCGEAELFLNGLSCGRQAMNDSTHVISWLVPYQPGVLSVKGYAAGKEVATDSLRTAQAPDRLRVSADVDQFPSDGKSIAHVTVTVVDHDGTPVYEADPEITCEVEGPAKLLGLENGDNSSHEPYTAPKRKAYHGRLLAYIQAGKTPGPVWVTLSSPGFEKQVVVIRGR